MGNLKSKLIIYIILAMINRSEAVAMRGAFIPAGPINYLTEIHRNFIEDYGDNCLSVANDVAGVLLSCGMSPSVYLLQGELQTDGKTRALLIPRLYKGKFSWGHHYVAIVDEVVCDPMFDEPLPLNIYLEKAFENNIVDVEKVIVGE